MDTKIKRPQVRLERTIHPIYRAHLQRLEDLGYTLEHVIAIASNAVLSTATMTARKEPKDSHEHFVQGWVEAHAILLSSAETCRESWERSYLIQGDNAAPTLWPEAVERLHKAVARQKEWMTNGCPFAE